jgi:hypothetical protein
MYRYLCPNLISLKTATQSCCRVTPDACHQKIIGKVKRPERLSTHDSIHLFTTEIAEHLEGNKHCQETTKQQISYIKGLQQKYNTVGGREQLGHKATTSGNTRHFGNIELC